MSAQDLPVPEGLVARFEHIRRVVLVVETHPNADCGPVLMFSDPILMNAHEWSRCREQGYQVHVLPNGGFTRCRLDRPSGVEGVPDELIVVGEIRCVLEDNYVKAIGRIKSLGKANAALKAGQLQLEERMATGA